MDKKITSNSEKILYSISEIAKIFNVNISLIRFWETKFDMIKPKRNKKGNRFFTQKDLEYFHLVFYLVKEKGMTLKGANKKIKENKAETIENFKIVQKLKSIKEMLLEIKTQIS